MLVPHGRCMGTAQDCEGAGEITVVELKVELTSCCSYGGARNGRTMVGLVSLSYESDGIDPSAAKTKLVTGP